ncbi:olfactory receptor 52N5-like protein [Lates japonicus]|uniref:Olfactory receptor 52N5-like protein n=1 Tax=Lates japonicus TaxID=270547 RepID=A0AAD3N9C1_LATJO|nr:olfactory receptor 52N5-like protein [Lates japonicus]
MTSARPNVAALAWFVAVLCIAMLFGFHMNVPLCGNIIKHVYSSNRAILSLACRSTPTNNIYGAGLPGTVVVCGHCHRQEPAPPMFVMVCNLVVCDRWGPPRCYRLMMHFDWGEEDASASRRPGLLCARCGVAVQTIPND